MKQFDKYSIDNLEKRSYHSSITKFPQEKMMQLTNLYTDSFMLMNPIWRKMKIPREEVYQVMEQRIKYAAEKGMITTMIVPQTEEIAMSTVGMDLYDYMKDHINDTVAKNEWWKGIKELAHELQSEYFKSLKFEKGQFYYGDIGACKIQFATKYNTQRFWLISLNSLRKNAKYKFLVGRSSNPISTKLMKRMGTEVMKKVYFKSPEILKDEFMELLFLDLEKVPEFPSPKL